MKAAISAVFLFTLLVLPIQAEDPVDRVENASRVAAAVSPYQFERGDTVFSDIVELADGSMRVGKVMEWADQILLYQGTGSPLVFSVPEVERFEFRRAEAHIKKPELSDLTVAFIERLPRDPSLQGHIAIKEGLPTIDLDMAGIDWHPKPGSEVTFRIHVLNSGSVDSEDVPSRVLVDGKEIRQARIPPLAPGKEHVLDVKWPWQAGTHTIRVDVDPNGKSPEISRWNNTFEEPINALGVTVVVARDRYDAFGTVPNMVDSFGFEDWVQYHLRCMNRLFAVSVYPSSPEGVAERVRCDRIIVVDDPTDDSKMRAMFNRGGKTNGLAEYAALLVFDRLGADELAKYSSLKINWSQLQNLGHQLGLVDLTATDTELSACMVLNQYERYAQRRHLFPWLQRLMHTAGGFRISEPGAAYLNRALGEPRGDEGEYLYQLPEKVTLNIRSNRGLPLPSVQVDVFQLMSQGEDAGYIVGAGREDPLYSLTTDEDGRVTLANQDAPSHKTTRGYELRPNPFGLIDTTGGNGLLLLRLRYGGVEEFHFLRLFDCAVAYLRGHVAEYVWRIESRFGGPDAPPAPPFTACRMEERGGDHPAMYVRWRFPKGVLFKSVKEFRVYKRTSFGGDETKPWTLVSKVEKGDGDWVLRHDGEYFDEFKYDGAYSLDTFFATTMVDTEGRESSLSAPCYLAHGEDSHKLAMDKHAAYMTLSGPGLGKMLWWDGRAGTQSYGIRTRRFKGYSPECAGIAMTPEGRFVMTDPRNHVLAFYDRGDLVDVMPRRNTWPGIPGSAPGEFHSPADVAIDAGGKLYVADRGNNRVQILDSHGGFLGLLDENFRFKGPHAIGFSHGHICVTDQQGSRCRVYDVSGDSPAFVRQLPLLADADRCLVSKTNNIYVAGRDATSEKPYIAVFSPFGAEAKFEKEITEGTMGKYHRPRGLFFFSATKCDYAYFVNQFLFDVRRVEME